MWSASTTLAGRDTARVTFVAPGMAGRPMNRPMESIIIIVRSTVLTPSVA
jgi:hypothetical protein